VLAGCGSELEPEYFEGDRVAHIAFSVMFSAYDSVHEYSVIPSVSDAADEPPFEGNPILASSIRWEVDNEFVSRSELPDLPNAIKLTTKKAGTTVITMIARHVSGPTFRQRAALTITMGTPEEWVAGDARFKQGPRVSLLDEFLESEAASCGLADKIGYPSTAACVSCHDPSGDGLDPTMTAGYSDDDLIEIVSAGAKPAGGTYNSDSLRDLSMPDCVFRAIHSYDFSEEEKRGIVLWLRSISPRTSPE